MDWWLPHNFEKKRPYLEKRGDLIRAVRSFFDENGFLEVETPVLQVMPTADVHIHGFKTELKGVDLRPERALYLQTSPEFAMKKLLVAGLPKIYQICHVFRNGEGSKLHSPEFTILEWYRAGADYRALIEDCRTLLRKTAQVLEITAFTYGPHTADPFLNWNLISASEAFDKYVEIDISKYLGDAESFAAVLKEKGIRTAERDSWDDLFHAAMAEKIEPHLGMGAPTILYDYPASMASLSRKKPDDPRFAERFELYVCGIELANAFSELTDAQEQRTRFEEDMDLKEQLYGEKYPIDEEFLQALELGLPESAGIALGIDRLAMLATSAQDIEQVLWAGKPVKI